MERSTKHVKNQMLKWAFKFLVWDSTLPFRTAKKKTNRPFFFQATHPEKCVLGLSCWECSWLKLTLDFLQEQLLHFLPTLVWDGGFGSRESGGGGSDSLVAEESESLSAIACRRRITLSFHGVAWRLIWYLLSKQELGCIFNTVGKFWVHYYGNKHSFL